MDTHTQIYIYIYCYVSRQGMLEVFNIGKSGIFILSCVCISQVFSYCLVFV